MTARPAPPRPPAGPAARPPHPAGATRPTGDVGAEPARLRPEERARLRRIVRAVLVGVVAIEALVLMVAAVPEARAFAELAFVTNFIEVVTPLELIDGKLVDANRHLAEIDRNTARSRDLADRHSQPLGGSAWDPAMAAVTSGPMGALRGGLSISDGGASAQLEKLVPGAVPWRNYHAEYAESADSTLATLRSSLDALNQHYKQIEDGSRLQDLATQAHSADSYLAMGELQVQSQLEVARQLHALRAQQALSTNLYAVAESHRIGAEARTNAKDKQANCNILAQVLSGGVINGAAVKAAICK